MILIEPGDRGARVSETFLFENQTQITYSDPSKGSVQFYVPDGRARKDSGDGQRPGGMPIPRPRRKDQEAGRL